MKYSKYTFLLIYLTISVLLPSVGYNESFYINNLGGGLNTKSSPLVVADNESSDCANVYFDTSGAVIKRFGQKPLSATTSTTGKIDGMYQYKQDDGDNWLMLVATSGSTSLWKVDNLDGIQDAITISDTTGFTSGTTASFATYQNVCIVTNGVDKVVEWPGTGDAQALDCFDDIVLTNAKFVESFKDRLFLANVTVNGTYYPNRVYYCDNQDITTWQGVSFLTVGYSDGEQITGMKVLGDECIIFKERSIWNIQYTGDPGTPFIITKSLASVGCVSGYSIQRVETHLIFLAPQGEIYAFNGVTAEKISGRIDPTIRGYSKTYYSKAVSANYRKLSQYWLSFYQSTSSKPDRVVVWDYFNNAFTIYTGLEVNAIVSYTDPSSQVEYLLTGDATYRQVFRQDYSTSTYSDYTAGNIATAIDGYYWTKWHTFQDLIHYKNTMFVVPLFDLEGSWDMDVSYQFDFADGIYKLETVSLENSADLIGVDFTIGISAMGKVGKSFHRVDLSSSGNAVRIKFSNNRADEHFAVYGFGIDVTQTQVIDNL